MSMPYCTVNFDGSLHISHTTKKAYFKKTSSFWLFIDWSLSCRGLFTYLEKSFQHLRTLLELSVQAPYVI